MWDEAEKGKGAFRCVRHAINRPASVTRPIGHWERMIDYGTNYLGIVHRNFDAGDSGRDKFRLTMRVRAERHGK
jgi:hypothetical protein